jgi:hypothetical protein
MSRGRPRTSLSRIELTPSAIDREAQEPDGDRPRHAAKRTWMAWRCFTLFLDGKFLVTLRVEGRGPHARMSLQTWDEAKKSRGVSTIECTRTVDEATSYALPTYRISLPLQTLRDVVAHFDSANVVLEELDGGPLRIQDGGKQFQATSWIAGVTEEKLAPPGRYIGGRQNRQASPSLSR